MKENEEKALGQVVDLLLTGLKKRKHEGIELERLSRAFWSKIKKRLPEELVTQLQEDPDHAENEARLTKEFGALMEIKKIKMSMAMFLFNNGIEPEM